MANRALRSFRHPALALVLPMVFLALGGWELSRVVGMAAVYTEGQAAFDSNIANIRQRAAADPKLVIRFSGDPARYTPADAIARLEGGRGRLGRDALVEQARIVAAWVVLASGVMGLLATTLCLVLTARGARRGRRSRDILVAEFGRVVRVLPPLLGCVAISVAAGVLGAVLFEIGGAWFVEGLDAGELKLIVLGLFIAGASVLFAIATVRQLFRALGAFTPQPMDVLGREASPAEAPGFWNFLGDVAGQVGADPPEHVVLGLSDGFFVTSGEIALQPEECQLSGRTLYLSASMLPLLSAAELRAILAHELAHFTGEDTRFTQHFVPLFAGMSRSMLAVTGAGRQTAGLSTIFVPAGVLAAHVLDTFDRVVSYWSRERELEADRASLRASSPRGAATALLRTGMSSEVVSSTLADVYSRPSKASPDFVGEVLARAAAVGFTGAEAQLEGHQPHPTDSHPSTRQRIEAFGLPIDAGLLAEASRAPSEGETGFIDSLFVDWTGFRRELGADLLGDATEHDRQYQEALEAAARAAPETELAIHERTVAVPVGIGVMGVVLLLLSLGLGFLALGMSSPGMEVGVFVAVPGVMGLLIVGWAIRRVRRVRSGPFLVLRAEGFTCAGIAGEVAWSDIAAIQVTSGQSFNTVFTFEDGVELPRRVGGSWAVKLDAKRRTLRLRGFVPGGMRAKAYGELLSRTVRAARARAVLRERAAEATSPEP